MTLLKVYEIIEAWKMSTFRIVFENAARKSSQRIWVRTFLTCYHTLAFIKILQIKRLLRS